MAQAGLECLEQVFESPQPRVFEYELELEDQTTGYCETRFVSSGPDEALIMVRDISTAKRAVKERERLHAQLQQAQKLESLGVPAYSGKGKFVIEPLNLSTLVAAGAS